MEPVKLTKVCSTCKLTLPLTSYHKSNQTLDGYKYSCKACRRDTYLQNQETEKEKRRLHYTNNKVSYLARAKRWATNNRQQKNKLNKEWAKTNRHYYAMYASSRRKGITQATPKWLTEDDFFLIEEIYHLAQIRTDMTKLEWHVDHIIPIKGKTVCGLHVPENLQVILGSENRKKSNLWKV